MFLTQMVMIAKVPISQMVKEIKVQSKVLHFRSLKVLNSSVMKYDEKTIV